MERNRFLELAARCAGGTPTLVSVNGMEYYPISYTITPKPGGGWSHSALLQDAQTFDSYRRVELCEVEEVQG